MKKISHLVPFFFRSSSVVDVGKKARNCLYTLRDLGRLIWNKWKWKWKCISSVPHLISRSDERTEKKECESREFFFMNITLFPLTQFLNCLGINEPFFILASSLSFLFPSFFLLLPLLLLHFLEQRSKVCLVIIPNLHFLKRYRKNSRSKWEREKNLKRLI